MKLKTMKIYIILIIVFSILVACSKSPNSRIEEVDKEANLIKVYTTFYPYYDFAQNIGENNIELHTIIPAGSEPHSFEPSLKTIAELENADVFIYNGLGMEPWADKVLNILKEDTYVVEASKAVDLIKYNDKLDTETEDNHGHDHEEEIEDNHEHGDYDPHIWVDPVNAIQISEMIKEAFIEVDNDNKNIYEENFHNFKQELEDLDLAFKEGLEDISNKKILVSHSAFKYLTNRYNIEEISVAGVSPHAEPTPSRLAELTKVANKNKINYIFFDALSSVKTAEVLANEANLEVLTLYNVEGLTEDQKNSNEDYVSLMYKNLDTLRKALVK